MKRVFIIDDERLMTELLQMLISRTSDIEVAAVVHNGHDAIETYEDTAADLTLLDLSLPGIPGIEVLRKLKQKLPERPVLVVSGVHDPTTVRRVKDAGADGYVLKGDPGRIIKGIRSVLAGERSFDVIGSF